MGWGDWVPISKSGSRKLDLAFSRESRMKMPSARPCRSNSSVFCGEKCDEHVRHFLSMECKEKGCHWSEKVRTHYGLMDLCVYWEMPKGGACVGVNGCVITFLDGEHRFRNPKQKKEQE